MGVVEEANSLKRPRFLIRKHEKTKTAFTLLERVDAPQRIPFVFNESVSSARHSCTVHDGSGTSNLGDAGQQKVEPS